jgi:dihydrofolate synthase/folylpolyglutamate synthase
LSFTASNDLLARLAGGFPRVIELSLRPAYFDLLKALGNPQHSLPPVIHVAGTNGKGSTCAFLRAILEASGKRVHVYTSPHLVHFHERIRLAGQLIDEQKLTELLHDVIRIIEPNTISQFEATTAAAFSAFAHTPADYLILETGLGGRYDATNIVEHPCASVISRISFDHREFLGHKLEQIAGEKAGIIKPTVPCFIGQQADSNVLDIFMREATEKSAPLYQYQNNWQTTVKSEQGFLYSDTFGSLDLPQPALLGAHQIANASLAMATLRYALGNTLPLDCYAQGLQQVEWPARLQPIKTGALYNMLPEGWELWLDGGHNDSAGEVLAAQAAQWHKEDSSLPLYVIYGMLKTKVPQEFLLPLAPHIAGICAVMIPDNTNSLSLEEEAAAAKDCGIASIMTAATIQQAIAAIQQHGQAPARLLICGSLYLAGHALEQNELKNSAT